MFTLRRLLALALVTVLVEPPYALATTVPRAIDSADATATDVPLSDQQLADVWGGVMGGKIGLRNGGVLELSCGDFDQAFNIVSSSDVPPYERMEYTHYAACSKFCNAVGCSNFDMHVVPHYFSGNTPQVAVSAAITRTRPDPGVTIPDPFVELFLNGKPFGTVPCVHGMAGTNYVGGWGLTSLAEIDANEGGSGLRLESWSCPGGGYFVQNIAGSNLRHGSDLNVMAARTVHNVPGSNGGDIEDKYKDQEVRVLTVD